MGVSQSSNQTRQQLEQNRHQGLPTGARQKRLDRSDNLLNDRSTAEPGRDRCRVDLGIARGNCREVGLAPGITQAIYRDEDIV